MVDPAPSTSNIVERTPQNNVEPLDISAKGQEKKKQHLQGKEFPKQTDGRSFQPSWIDKFPWIEYSMLNDKVCCYACRQFGLGDAFNSVGYDTWKKALNFGQGFRKHESTITHMNAMLTWTESEKRKNQDMQITTILNENVLEKRRYYFKSIVGTIIFLVKNELPLRGDWNREEN